MLRNLSFLLIFLIHFNVLSVFGSKAATSFVEGKSCQESPVKGTPCNEEVYQNNFTKSNPFYEKEVLTLQKESLQKVEALFQDKGFQTFVSDLQNKLPDLPNSHKSREERKPQGELLIFVSFSLGEKALLNLALEAKLYGAILVLRGFKDNSHRQTVLSLQKIIQKTMSSGDRPGEGQGFIIDPELYTLFAIEAVPTVVLSKPFEINASERTHTPLHDRLQGHVSLNFALERFAKEGDLKDAALPLLERGKSL